MVKQVSRLDVIAGQGGGFSTLDKSSFYFAKQNTLNVNERILLD